MKALRNIAWLMLATMLILPAVSSAQPGAFRPPLLDCGQHGNAEAICGTRAPEDFEITPDGRYLIIAAFGQGEGPTLSLFELSSRTFRPLPLSAEPSAAWGEASCTQALGDQVSPHGLSLSQRSSGEWQFYLVNHNIRESMEMYELMPQGESWKLVWRGCVLAQEPYNDVAALADGSFVATRPQALQQEGQDLFAGEPSGNVGIWTAGEGEKVLPGTATGYPNGVLVSADRRYAYVSGWTTLDFHKYDLNTLQEVGRADFSFMPDNLTWTSRGTILAAGIKGVQGNCPADSEDPCLQGFVVAEVDPQTLAVKEVFDNEGRALINGTSVAIEAGDSIYVGSFQGTRMVRIQP